MQEESPGVYYIALELASPEAIDAATYKLNARNEHGESNANLKLNFDGEYTICSLMNLFVQGHEVQQSQLAVQSTAFVRHRKCVPEKKEKICESEQLRV